MPVRTWSRTAAQNNSAPPFGWPEGMPPSGVNDSARQVMADARAAFEDVPWLEWPDAITYVNETTFRVADDARARYQVGRRLRVAQASTIYGTITASTYTGGLTTVVVAWDAGSLSNASAIVSLGTPVTGQPVSMAGVRGAEAFVTVSQLAQVKLPVGSVIVWPLPTPPDGYLLGNGQAVSRTAFADLFAVYGTTFGIGNGTTTFNLPNYTDRFLVGAGALVGTAAGAVGGASQKTLAWTNLPPHSHDAPDKATPSPEGVPHGYVVMGATGATLDFDHSGETSIMAVKAATAPFGGNGSGAADPITIIPPAASVWWCIRWRA